MSTSSKRGIIIAVLIALLTGGLLAFHSFQDRNSGAAEAAGPTGAGGPRDANGQWSGGGGPPGGSAGRGMGGGNFGSNRPPLVELGMATEGAVREQISLVGSLKPKQQVEVIPKITGRVARVLVDVGDRVKEGQLIAELEGDELEQQVLRAEATLGVAEATLAQRQAELANAQADQVRGQKLFSEGLVSVQSQDSLETRVRVVESQLKLAEAQVRQAQADLAELQIRQQQTKLVSPLTGWVARRYVDVGAMVNPNSPIVNVLDLATMITEVKVPEEQMTKLRLGNRAVVALDAMAGQTYEGRVARMAPVLDAATRSGSVQVEIANPGGQLKAEMSARIQMEMGSEHRAVLVPRDAVVVRGEQTGVNVLEGARVRFQRIETGVSTDHGVEVLQGLNPGTTIVTRGSQGLQEGAVVEVHGKSVAAGFPEDGS